MNSVHKVCPCVVRSRQGRLEILVFEHPLAGHQLVKGTVEAGEDLPGAALRELAEESGLTPSMGMVLGRKLGVLDFEVSPSERQHWHLYLVQQDVHSTQALPEHWVHEATGSPEEEGLSFRFYWTDLQHFEAALFHPRFVTVLQWIASLSAKEIQS